MEYEDYNTLLKELINRCRATLFTLLLSSLFLVFYLLQLYLPPPSIYVSDSFVIHSRLKVINIGFKKDKGLRGEDSAWIMDYGPYEDNLSSYCKTYPKINTWRFIQNKLNECISHIEKLIEDKNKNNLNDNRIIRIYSTIKRANDALNEYLEIEPNKSYVVASRRKEQDSNEINVSGIALSSEQGMFLFSMANLFLLIYLRSLSQMILCNVKNGCVISRSFIFFHVSRTSVLLGRAWVLIPSLLIPPTLYLSIIVFIKSFFDSDFGVGIWIVTLLILCVCLFIYWTVQNNFKQVKNKIYNTIKKTNYYKYL